MYIYIYREREIHIHIYIYIHTHRHIGITISNSNTTTINDNLRKASDTAAATTMVVSRMPGDVPPKGRVLLVERRDRALPPARKHIYGRFP